MMNTRIVYRKKLFTLLVAFVLICLVLGLISMYILDSKVISIAVLVAMVLPLFFLRLLLSVFAKKASIELYSDHFVIIVWNRDGGQSLKKIYLRDILSYSIQLPIDNVSDIKFRLIDGNKPNYSFSQDKGTTNGPSGREIINSFHLLISNYNREPSTHSKIEFRPSFYASSIGLIFISLIVGLLFITIIIIFIVKEDPFFPSTLIFTLLIVFHLMAKRRKELDYYNRMKKGESSFSYE